MTAQLGTTWGRFFHGGVSASATAAYSLPLGVTLAWSQIRLSIGSAEGTLGDSGTVPGNSASASGFVQGCNVFVSVHAHAQGVGSDGLHYAPVSITYGLTGRASPGIVSGTIASPPASTLADQPGSASGTTGGRTVTLRLDDLTAGGTIAVGTPVIVGSAWSASLPALPMSRSYRLSATFSDGAPCAQPTTATVEFALPVRFIRERAWLVLSAIGPAIVSHWQVRTAIRRFVDSPFAVVSVIHSPIPGAPAAEGIAAALRPLHTFRARLLVRWDGTNWDEETGRLLDAGGVDDVDLRLRWLNSAEATFTLDDSDAKFNLVNPASPVAPFIRRLGHDIWLQGGYDGWMSTIFRGTVESITPRMADRTVVLRALDRGARLRTLRGSVAPVAGARTDQIARTLLTAAGLVESVDFSLDTGDVTIPWAVAADVPVLPEVQALAQAEGGRVFLDETGVLRFWSGSRTRRVMAAPIVTLDTDAHLYELGRSTSPAGMASRVSMEWTTREHNLAPERIFDLRLPLQIPPGYTGATLTPAGTVENWTYVGPAVAVRALPMDLTRWEQFVPAEFTAVETVAANTLRDGTGSAVTVVAGSPPDPAVRAHTGNLFYTSVLRVGWAEIVFFNDRSTPVFVRTLRLTGVPQRNMSPVRVTARDPDAVDDIELVLANPYAPDAHLAQERVNEELAYRRDALLRLNVPLQDGLPFLRAFDVLRVIDRSVPRVEHVTDGQVLRNSWRLSPSDGYTQDLVLGPALPAQYRAATSVAVTRESVSRTVDQAPWRWFNPYYEGHLRRADVVHPWRSTPVPRSYANAATLLVSTDVPAGNPTAWSCLFRFTAVSDQIGFVALPAPMRAGVTYTVRFWLRRLAGTGNVQWFVGDHLSSVGGRTHAFDQSPPAAWEERSIAWTPSADCPDPILAFLSWGAVTSDVAVARVTVTHGAPVKASRWTAGAQWQ